MSKRINSLSEKYIVGMICSEANGNAFIGECENISALKRLEKDGFAVKSPDGWLATNVAKKAFANDERLLVELSKAGRRFISHLTESAELKALVEKYS